jgi:hypothetical protein
MKPFHLAGGRAVCKLTHVGCVKVDYYFPLLSFDSSAMVALSS